MRYVAGFLFSSDFQRVVLVRKNKPAWQKGRLNGVGGKIEGDELAEVAMAREFAEEAGLQTIPELWSHYATMKGDPLKGENWCVYVFAAVGNVDGLRSLEEEQVGVFPVWKISTYVIVENLPWLITLAIDHLADGRPKFTEISYT